MGVHSSLKKSSKLAAARSVMSRGERIKLMQDKGSWSEDSGKVLGLPKIKIIKIKAAKKAVKAPEDKKAGAAGKGAPAKK